MEEKVQFAHLFLGKGRCTIAFKNEGSTTKVAYALCSPKDQFCKKIGRNIAEGRLNKGKFFVVEENKTLNDITKNSLNTILNSKDLPNWI